MRPSVSSTVLLAQRLASCTDPPGYRFTDLFSVRYLIEGKKSVELCTQGTSFSARETCRKLSRLANKD